MDGMPCGNTAALRQFENRNDAAEKRHETVAPRIIEDLVNHIIEGGAITLRNDKCDLADILESELADIFDPRTCGRLLMASNEDRDDILDFEIEPKVRAALKTFFEDSDVGQAVVGDRVAEEVEEADAA